MRLNAGQRGVEGQFAHRNAHSLDAQIAQAQNPLPVGDHDGPHVVLGPVLHDVVDVAFVVDGDEQTLGPPALSNEVNNVATPNDPQHVPESVAELLAGQAHGGRVHDGHQFLDVL